MPVPGRSYCNKVLTSVLNSFGSVGRRSSKAPESWGGYWEQALFMDTAVLQTCKCIDTDSEMEREGSDPRMKLRDLRWLPGKQSCVATHVLQEQIPLQVAVGTACSGLMLGLHLAFWKGLGGGLPPLMGVLSSILATGGVASSVLALQGPPARDRVELPPWLLLALSGICATVAPLPLVPLSLTSMSGVALTAKVALPGALGSVVMFEVGHRHWARIDPLRVAILSSPMEVLQAFDGARTDGFAARVRRLWWRHFAPLPGTDRGVGSVLFVAQLAVTYFGVNIDYVMTQWKNGFFSTLQARDVTGFYGSLWDFVPIVVASTVAGIYSEYLSTMWDLRWREELTHDFVHMWLDRKAYYYVRFSEKGNGAIDNFDQRIVQDTALFASTSRALLCGGAEALLRLAVFGPALVRLSPSPAVWQFCIAMSVVSSILTHIVGKPLAAQNATIQRTEADFRAALMRLRIFAEDIAMQHGEAAEGAGAVRCLENIKAATWNAARRTLKLVSFTSAYGLVGSIMPFLVLVPYYFHGDISLGTMFQLEGVVSGVRSSLDFFIGSYGGIAEWHASASRLLALEACATHAPGEIPFELCDKSRGGHDEEIDALEEGMDCASTLPSLQARNLAIGPAGAEILRNVCFRWQAGDRISISGPAGSGKSALLRALAGAWPPPSSGSISSSAGTGVCSEVLLVSSGGFLLPSSTTLRKCLAYPEAIAAFDDDLREALSECGLSHLESQLDREADWSTELCLSDRQRLAFARIFARWPIGMRWLLLDDADGALSSSAALHLHKCLAAHQPPNAALVVASRHPEVVQQLGWRHFQIDPQDRQLFELPEALPSTGEAPAPSIEGLSH